ncbi:flexible cuticle protein 12-like [Penaeus indicus]|uniref:flexible cuticle protein 12-like n=1 Tax=Penaeus indicus TaxID=29960 RepID=UPI00300CC51F
MLKRLVLQSRGGMSEQLDRKQRQKGKVRSELPKAKKAKKGFVLIGNLACLVAVVVADSYKTPIPILKNDRIQNAYGEYTFDFETGNGIVRNEAGKQADGQESSGGWSYTAPEGVPIKLSFTSGVGGYQPVGDHLPVAPTSVPLPYERNDY